jgi:hypothetical protein
VLERDPVSPQQRRELLRVPWIYHYFIF